MAVFTPLDVATAAHIARRLALGTVERIEPIAAGSVNSNFALHLSGGRRVFLRIHEEQGTDGVAFEWELLDVLARAGAAVVAPLRGEPPTAPGELGVGGKPVAVFPFVDGEPSCQRGVTVARAAHVGELLARCHGVARASGLSRRGRFGPDEIRERFERARRSTVRRDVLDAVDRLEGVLDELVATREPSLPVAVVHGDLFRDNVLWRGDELVAVLDWESAADERLVYDLAVTMLAWCYGDDLDLDLARAMVASYDRVRPLEPVERRALRREAMMACVRFGATRITDYALREGIGNRVVKDYRRFLARLDRVSRFDDDGFVAALLG
ncbi:MAG: homoserine kinase [Deltaproteobacteria bacterium]|nr:homoserine kinase [Deltaproteobacteria bacterium]